MSRKKILVTGIGGYWGSRVALKLVEHPEYHVMGLDSLAPAEPIPGLDFIQADIRNPLLVELLKSEQVDTVYHLAFKESVRPSETTFDYNVMGSMKVFGACAEAGISTIILKSSTAVYGAHPRNPAFLKEHHPLNGSRAYGSTRDLMEIEAFCNGFQAQAPQIDLTILRFPSIVGPTADTAMTRYLKEPISPALLGFDPVMQLIHEDDVVNALASVAANDLPGVFNIAAEDLMPLSKIMGLVRKPRLPVFHLFAYWGYGLVGSKGLRLSQHVPMELDYIRYRWVGDLERMQTELNFSPTYSAEDALQALADQRQKKRYMPEAIARTYDVDRFKQIIERRRARNQGTTDEEPEGQDL